ncbi:MAG: GAF domain-containing protein [Candidatus Thorarchaeota archaeon]
MLTTSELEFFRKYIKETLDEDLSYFSGMYVLDTSKSSFHFCERIGLMFQEEKWCPGFLKCFRVEKNDTFAYKCPIGIIHYFVPLKCFNKHITNVCIASRRVSEKPNLEWIKKQTGKDKIRREKQGMKHFMKILPAGGTDKQDITERQKKIQKLFSHVEKKGVGSSVFLRNVFSEISSKETNYKNLLTEIRDKSVEITKADRGCLFLDENGKYEHIIPCLEYEFKKRRCSVHTHNQCFDRVIREKKPILLPRDHPNFPMGKDVLSSLTIPLMNNGSAIGLIHVSSKDYINFNNIHTERLQELAKFATAVINNARSIEKKTAEFEEKSIEVKRLITLFEVDSKMQDSFNEEHALVLFLLGIVLEEGLGFDRALYFEYYKKTNKLTGKIGLGPVNKKHAQKVKNEYLNSRLSLERSEEGYKFNGLPDKELNKAVKEIDFFLDDSYIDFLDCIRNKKTKSIKNMNSTNRYIKSIDLDSINIIMVPIIYKHDNIQEVLGILIVDKIFSTIDEKKSDEIHERDINLLEAFVKHIAVTLKHIKDTIAEGRDLEETKSQLRNALMERKNIGLIGNIIAQNLELDKVLQKIMDETLGLAKSYRGSIMLYKDKKKVLELEKGVNLPTDRKYKIKLGDDIFSKAIKEKSVIIVDDFDKVPDKRFNTDYQIRSRMIVPLVIGDDAIGVISVDNNQPNKYTLNEQRKLLILADYAAIAIQNAQLFEKASGKNVLENLYKIGQEITSQVELERVLNCIVDNAINVLAEDLNLGILLSNDKKKELVLEASHGTKRVPAIELGFSIPIKGVQGKSLIAYCYRENKIVYKSDILYEKLYLETTQNVRSELDIPLRYRDEVIGVLSAQSEKINGFNKEMIGLLVNYASQAAIAIKNAQLLKQYTVTNEKLMMVLKILNHQLGKHPKNIKVGCDLLLNYNNLKPDKKNELLQTMRHEAFLTYKNLENINVWYRLTELKGKRKRTKRNEDFNVNKEINKHLSSHKEIIEKKNININIDICLSKIPLLKTNFDYATLAFANLLDNAVKFTGDNGNILISGIKLKKAIVINIKDDGIGIPQEELEYISNVFFRGSNVEGYAGSGVGLYIVEELCRLLKWRIKYKSSTGKNSGTDVMIRIPKDF